VPDHDFLFALDVSGDADTGRMLGELCTAVLGHVGLGAPAIAELTSALSGAVAKSGANGARRCDVRFVAQGGQLQIVVSCPGAADWRTTRPLPTS
jgi:hypothetical protein